jgi:CubicO group peptidase (beta-lactamase class C family)
MAALDLGVGPPQPAVPPEPDEWVRRLGTLPLSFQPGERWLYHTGADILGVLVARAAGQPFEAFLQQRLFGPLGMVDTAFSVPADKLDRFGPVYNGRTVADPRDGQWATPPKFPGGGAGLVSTLDDYLAFARMLLADGAYDGDQILSPELVAEMTTNQLTPEQLAQSAPSFDGSLGWGLGLSVHLRPGPGASAGTYGWNGGYGTAWGNDPAEGVVALLLTNQMWRSPVPPPIFQDVWSAL